MVSALSFGFESTQVYKWVLANLILWVILHISHSSIRSVNFARHLNEGLACILSLERILTSGDIFSSQLAVQCRIIVPMDQHCHKFVIQESTVHVQSCLNQNLTVKEAITAHREQRKLIPRMELQEIDVLKGRTAQEEVTHLRIVQLEHS